MLYPLLYLKCHTSPMSYILYIVLKVIYCFDVFLRKMFCCFFFFFYCSSVRRLNRHVFATSTNARHFFCLECMGCRLEKILFILSHRFFELIYNEICPIFIVIIFVQALKLCLSANQYTLCSLLMKGQSPKRQAVQRLRKCV